MNIRYKASFVYSSLDKNLPFYITEQTSENVFLKKHTILDIRYFLGTSAIMYFVHANVLQVNSIYILSCK